MGTLSHTIYNRSGLNSIDFEELCKKFCDLLMDLTPVKTGWCQSRWEIIDDNDYEATFFNDAEYASFLEDGWSKQAPDGMLGPALEQLPGMIEQYT